MPRKGVGKGIEKIGRSNRVDPIAIKKPRQPTTLEMEFDAAWELYYPHIDLETEQTLIPGRKFQFDYSHLTSRVAIEVNGGIHQQMGHSTGSGIRRDYEKNNLAIATGWIVFNLCPEMITHDWLELIANTIEEREAQIGLSNSGCATKNEELVGEKL